MADDMRECPIDGCTKRHPTRILMCKAHWRLVPRDLQRRVYATARKMWNGEGSLDWVEASDAAIAAVEMREAEG